MKPLIKTVFVLAAGRGERLRPYTDKVPKPLLPIQGRPLLDHILKSLESLQVERVVLNAWHLKEQIVDYAKASAKRFSFEILVSEENSLLGTGGGLKKAKPLISELPFLMMNGDCLWAGDLKAFVASGVQSDAEAVWWLAPKQADQTPVGFSKGRIHKIGALWASGETIDGEYCYSGIQLFNSLEVDSLPDSGCIIRNYWIPRLQKGSMLAGEVRFLKSWQDIGTPERYESQR